MSLNEENYKLMGLPPLFYDANWKFCQDNGLSEHIEKYLKRVDLAYEQGIGVFLGGRPSTGKSYIAAVIAKVHRKRLRSVQWLDAVSGYDLLAWNKEFHDEAYLTWGNRCEMVDVLIIDNFGAEKTVKKSKIMLDLLRKRTENKKLTIITTRMTLAELSEVYGEDVTFVKNSMKNIALNNKIEGSRQQSIKDLF